MTDVVRTQNDPPDFRALPPAARFYVAIVIVCGSLLLTLSGTRGAFVRPVLLVAFAALSVVCSVIKITLPVGSSYSTLSIGYAVSYLSLLVLGPGATSWVAMAGGWAQCSFNRKTKTPWYRTAFSMSSLVLAMEAAAQVLRLSGGSGPEASLDVLIRSVVASSLVYFFANTALIAIVMALQSRRSIFRVWDQDYLWSAPNYLIGAFAAAIAVRGFHAWGYASIVLLGLPLFLTYRLYTVYLSRVEDERRHVSELSTMHLATVEALALAIDAKDPTVKSHVQRVQLYAIALAKAIQAPDTVIDGVRVAALLHDVGKVGVPDHILTKTEPLTE
jgi:hypothetical protein